MVLDCIHYTKFSVSAFCEETNQFQETEVSERTTQMSNLSTRSRPLVIFEGSACLAMDVASFVGNALVCLAVYRNTNLRTTTNLYIIALAVADLMSALIVMPLATGVLFKGRWIYGDVMCKVHGFVSLFVLYVSPATMSLTAINRYVRIVRTNSYKTLFSPRRSRAILSCVWIVVVLYVIIPLILGWQDLGFVPGYAQCSIVHLSETAKLIHYCIVLFVFLFLPLVITTVSYYKVYKQIHQHNLDVAPSLQNRSSGPEGRISAQEVRLSKSLFAVVLAFLVCWIPLWVIVLLKRFYIEYTLPRSVELLCMFFLYLSNTINPFIYAGMNRVFRREFRSIIMCGRMANTAPRSSILEMGRRRAIIEREVRHKETSQRNEGMASDQKKATK